MITSSGLSDPSGDPARFIDGEPSRRRERLSGRRAEGEHYHPRAVRAARSGAGNNSATIAESNGRALSSPWHAAIYKPAFGSRARACACGDAMASALGIPQRLCCDWISGNRLAVAYQ